MGAITSTAHGSQVQRARIGGCSKLAAFDNAPWPVRILGCHDKGSTYHFELEVTSPCGQFSFIVSRSLEEFQRAHDEMKGNLEGEMVKDIPNIGDVLESPSACAQLQQWFDHVTGASLSPQWPLLQSLLSVPNSSNLWVVPATPSLTMIAECHQPILEEIASYLTASPSDLVNFCSGISWSLAKQLAPARNSLWESAFTARWPAMHDCLVYQGEGDWQGAYRQILNGRRECLLEVFDREKKTGFAMSAMAAWIHYDQLEDAFVAKYLSASEVSPETIPAIESRRLRFCPPSAHEQLQPGAGIDAAESKGQGRPRANSGASADGCTTKERPSCYPYRVLEGHEDLVAGQGVELQFTMQHGSPFGWWYGHLEELHRDADGKLAKATIAFKHFPTTSRLYRLEVVFGDSEMRPCAFGGWTGGIRAASEGERKHWMRFLPKGLVTF